MTITPAFEILGENRDSNVIITCDHASNRVPVAVGGGSLGLSAAEMDRHIAYDVGAAGVSKHLGDLLNVPVILSNFSRLVIDPNRGEDDPTLVMKLYDGTLVPLNRHITQADFDWRMAHCYRPYHDALGSLVASRQNPVIIAMHSFTAQLAGRPPRPWQIGVLFADDRRLSDPLIAALSRHPDLCVGVNEPYGGHLEGDSIQRHALAHGHPNILIEIRNDLIRPKAGQRQWAEKLAPILRDVIAQTVVNETRL